MENANEGRTRALSDAQARRLLSAPEGDSLPARRDRALLAVLLYHGLRRDEVARLTVGSLHEHRGVAHLRVRGKGSKTRPAPIHPAALSALDEYLELATHGRDRQAPLFQPTQARWAGRSRATASTNSSGSTPPWPPSPWSGSSTRSGPPQPSWLHHTPRQSPPELITS